MKFIRVQEKEIDTSFLKFYKLVDSIEIKIQKKDLGKIDMIFKTTNAFKPIYFSKIYIQKYKNDFFCIKIYELRNYEVIEK